MFLSIKWKAILFFSLLLLLISFTWLSISIQKSMSNLQQEIDYKTNRQELIFQELLTDQFQKLSQYAQLIVSAPAVSNETPTYKNIAIQKYIDDNAFNWGLNLNMEFFILINENQQIIAETGALSSKQKLNLKKALHKDIKLALQEPQKMVFCDSDCLQLVLEPFVFQNGEKGVVGYAQNMSSLVSRYAYLSNTDIAILLAQKTPSTENSTEILKFDDTTVNIQTNNELKGRFWQPWAISNFQTQLPIVKKFYRIGVNTELSLSSVFNIDYFFNTLSVQNIKHVGKPALYLNVFSDKKRLAVFKDNLMNTTTITLIVFVFAEIILIMLLLGPLKKIKRIAAIYENLPNNKNQTSDYLVSGSKSFFKDEITSIEHNTLKLANDLKGLEEDAALSQQKLKQKLLVLNSSQSHLQQLFDQSPLYIATLNSDMKIVSTNRNLQKIFKKSLQNTNWLSLVSVIEEKQKLAEELEALHQKQQPEIQMLMTVNAQKNIKLQELKVFWSYAIVTDNNGEEKILAVGLPLTSTNLFSSQNDAGEHVSQPSASNIGDDQFSVDSEKRLSQTQSELALIVRNEVEKQAFKLFFQPRFAVKHLVIREYEAVISLQNPVGVSMDYSSIKQTLCHDFDDFVMDKWLIETVFKRVLDELDYRQNLGIYIPINFSVFLSKAFLTLLQHLNSEYSLPFASVNFELTELDVNTEEVKKIQSRVEELHQMGHEVSCQFNQMHTINIIEKLNIDNITLSKCLFDDEENRQELQKHLKETRKRGLSTTVIGLKNQEDYLRLKQLEIDKVQGDFIKEPQASLLNTLDIVAIQASIKNL